MKRSASTLLALILLVVASWRPLVANFLFNWAGIELRHIETTEVNTGPDTFFWGVGIRSALPVPEEILSRQPQLSCGKMVRILDQPAIYSVMRKLQRAKSFWPSHATSAELLARTYLLAGHPGKTIALLSEETTRFPDNPLLAVYLGDAYDMLGDPNTAITLYREALGRGRRESVSANYILLAESAESKADEETWFAKALEIDPSNLYALYRLYSIFHARDNTVGPGNYLYRLKHFTADSISPPCDRRLQLRMQELIPRLVEETIWSPDTAVKVANTWIQAGGVGEAAVIVDRLWQMDRSNPRLAYARGQIYQQLGNIDKARQSYHDAIDIAVDYIPAYYALGSLLDEVGHPKQALGYFSKSYSLSGDLASLEKLVDLCKTTPAYGCHGDWQENLRQHTDDALIVANLLRVEKSRLELGPSLLPNVSDESWYWSPMFSAKIWNQALFLGWKETTGQFTGTGALHVTGFWAIHDPGLQPARAGFWGPKISLQPGATYVLSFLYKTEGLHDGHATVYLSENPEALFAGDHPLPETDGAWRKFLVIGQSHSSDPISIQPLVRSFGIGDVWFKDIALRELLAPTDLSRPRPIFEIR